MHKRASGQVVETATEARQGYLDRPVFLVLTISTVLAAALLFMLWMATT